MIVTVFDPRSELIIVSATVWGPHDNPHDVVLALDTAASEAILTPDITDALGYSARDGDARTVVRSAIGSEPGYLLRVRRFAALGFELSDLFRAQARVAEWARTGSTHPHWVATWQRLLVLPLPAVIEALGDTGEAMTAARQSTPFAGALSARERWALWRSVPAAP